MNPYRILIGFWAVVCLACCGCPAHAQVYFALQPAAHSPGKTDIPRGDRLIDLAEMRTAGVDGTTVRWRRTWPLSFIDQCEARVAQAGDVWTLLACSGDSSDPSSEANLRSWDATITLLAAEFGDDPRLWGVHVTGCSPLGTSEELHWERPISAKVEAANKRLITRWAAAFPRQKILLAISLKDPACMERLIKHGLSVAPGRFLVKHNAMKASTSLDAPQNKLVASAGRQGAMIGFEMVGSTLESRFGGTFQQMQAKADAVAKSASKPLSYMAIYPPDLGKIGGVR